MAEIVHPTPEDGSLDPGEGIEGESIQQGTPVTPEPGNSGTGLGEDANGNPTEPYPGAGERPTSWSEVDPDYQELLTDAEAEAQEDTDDDLIDDPAPDLDPEEAAKLQGPVWATYELWGRNVDESGQWRLVATEKFDGELEAEVGDLDTDSTHEYKVRLVDADGRRSKFSEVIQVTTPSDLTAPSAPTTPVVVESMSFVDIAWDGALTLETPSDFSHVNVYIRQLHPVGDPDGEAGDSQLKSRLSEKGAWTSGALPQALHEVWLTAVDATGNESPASSTVEFTPTKPVDEASISQKISKTEQSINTGLSDLDTKLRAEIETAAGNTIQRKTVAPTAADGADVYPGQRWERWTTLAVGGTITGTWVWDGSAWIESGLDETYLPKVHIADGSYGNLGGERLEADSVMADKVLIGMDNMFPNAGLSRPVRADGTIPFWGDGGGADDWVLNDESETWTSHSISVVGVHNQNTGQFPIEGGERYRFRSMVRADVDGSAYRIRLVTDTSTSPLLPDEEEGNAPIAETFWEEHVTEFVAPEGATTANIRFQTNDGTGSTQAAEQFFAGFQLRHMNAGELLVDGAIKGRHVEASESMSAKIAEFLNVKAAHIDFNSMVGSSAFIAEMETSNVKLASEVTNRRFEISGEGWVLTDTSTGEVLASVGVDGTILMKNATVQGRFETSYSGGSGITIDYGSLRYYSLKSQAWRTTTAPYLRIADGSGSADDQPAITVHNSELTVAPGRDSDGSARYINLDGRVLMNSGVASADFRAGSFSSRDYPFNMDANAVQMRFTAEDNTRVFGIGNSGYRLKIWGEMGAGDGQDDTFVHGRTGFMSLDSGYGMQGTITYGSPPRTGSRQPYVTSLVSTGSRDAFRAVVASASAAGSSGFSWVARAPSSNPGNVSFRIMYHAIWGST